MFFRRIRVTRPYIYSVLLPTKITTDPSTIKNTLTDNIITLWNNLSHDIAFLSYSAERELVFSFLHHTAETLILNLKMYIYLF